jgi:hypothetical protein
MALVIFIAGVLVAGILSRQAARQEAALKKVCEAFGMPVPPKKKPLPWAEIWLNLYIGATIAVISLLYVAVTFINLQDRYAHEVASLGTAAAGTGIAMIVLAMRHIKEHRK